MNHYQMTTRLLLLLTCLFLLGGLLYYFISLGIKPLEAVSNKVATSSSATTNDSVSSVLPTSTENISASSSSGVSVKPTPALATGEITITNTFGNKDTDVLVGEPIAFNLDPNLHWTLTFSPTNVMQEVSASSTNAAQGTYKAVAAGTVTVTANGAPICKVHQACPMFLAVFSTTLIAK